MKSSPHLLLLGNHPQPRTITLRGSLCRLPPTGLHQEHRLAMDCCQGLGLWGCTTTRPDSLRTALHFGVALYQDMLRFHRPRSRVREGLPSSPISLRCMPTPLRRSGSGLLQIPGPGCCLRLTPPGSARSVPHGICFRRGRVRLSLRPATLLLLASPPGSHRTPEVDFRAPLAACPGGTHTRRLIGPIWATLGHENYVRGVRVCEGLMGPRCGCGR
jgi:hypothetical protein